MSALVFAILVSCSKSAAPPTPSPEPCEDVSGVVRCVLTEGDGALVEPGPVLVHYTGWLSDGTKFDSSRDRGKPFQFVAGAGRVIPAWDVAVPGMRYGGRYRITVPPELGYGARGAGGVIPANETLTFEIEPIGVP